MQKSDLRSYTRLILAETDPTTSYWSDSDIDTFVQRGYEDVCILGELLQCVSKSKTFIASAATMPDDGMYAIPIDMLRILRLFVFDSVNVKWVKMIPATL